MKLLAILLILISYAFTEDIFYTLNDMNSSLTFVQESFLKDIKNNRVQEIKKNLNQLEEISYYDSYGNSPLFYAIATNNPKLVLLLINRQARLKHQNNEDSTALHIAVQVNNNEIVQNILDFAPYLIDYKDNLGNTAFFYAEQNNATDIIETIKYYKKQYESQKTQETLETFIKTFNTPILEKIGEEK